MVRGIIIGHGDFAKAIVATVEKIVGEQPDIEVISNTGLSCETLSEQIVRVLNEKKEADTLIFLDLPGGSCTISCYTVLKDHRDLNVISGVNLPMLLEFFMLREKHTAYELVPILIKKGKENIIQLRCKDE
jgi:mannose/fructose-specific phosphotransferase system component IIA